MNCIGFPKMFKGNSTVIKTDKANTVLTVLDNTVTKSTTIANEATRECVYLLINSECRDLFGDPEFGIHLKRYLYDQNNVILKDVLIDDIYTQITTFCPQVFLERSNIDIKQQKTKLYATITYKNRTDFTTDTLNLMLMNIGEKE